jgi:hypothetical protein
MHTVASLQQKPYSLARKMFCSLEISMDIYPLLMRRIENQEVWKRGVLHKYSVTNRALYDVV